MVDLFFLFLLCHREKTQSFPKYVPRSQTSYHVFHQDQPLTTSSIPRYSINNHPKTMAPLSRFAIAALAVVGVAAVPLPTQPSASTTLERRFDPFFDMLEWWAEHGPLEDLGDRVSYKPDIDVGIEVEKGLKEDPTKGEGPPTQGGKCLHCPGDSGS